MAEIDYSTGIVVKPESPTAIGNLIGDATNDVRTVCISDKVNIFSLHKPTAWASKPFIMTDADAEAQPKGKTTASDDYVRGLTNYGIVKPGLLLPASYIGTWFTGSDSSTAAYIGAIGSTMLNGVWSQEKPTIYRLDDFLNYIHTKQTYPCSHTTVPFSVSASCIEDTAYDISPSAILNYDFDNLVVDTAELLGMDCIFNDNLDKYFGLIVYAPTSKYAIVLKSDYALGAYDSNTGSTNIAYVGVEKLERTKGTTTYCAKGETIKLIPVILVPCTVSGVSYYSVVSLNHETVRYADYTIKEEGTQSESTYISNIALTYTVEKTAANTYRFYVASASDMVVTLSSTKASPWTLRMQNGNWIGLMPGDGNTNVQSVINGRFGSLDDDGYYYDLTLYSKSFNAETMIAVNGDRAGYNWSSSMDPAYRPMTLIVKSSATSFKVNFAFPYMKELNVYKNISQTITVDVSDLSVGSSKTIVFDNLNDTE